MAKTATEIAPVARIAMAAWGGVLVVFLGFAAVAADDGVIAADAAIARAERGELVLIDVRSPGEWRATGVPKGAKTVTIHDPRGAKGFVEAVMAAVGRDVDKPIALICARGNRSTIATGLLTRAGFTRVQNIREGMLGNPGGPGWLARGLPVEKCKAC